MNSSGQRRSDDLQFENHDDWARWVKRYYQAVETYDWVDVADNWRGPEAVFHRGRARLVRGMVSKYMPTGTILDAGCGTGLNLRWLPVGSIGLDINPRNIEVVQRRLPQFESVLGDIEDMPFEDETFSGVICTEVLEHVPDPHTALKQIWRVLRPGGVVIGTVPARSPVWRLRFLSSTCPAGEPFHHEYRVSEIREMLGYFDLVTVRYALIGSSVAFVARRLD
jgi:SAM-dependent methyltransferase